MNIKNAINILNKQVPDPSLGLPDEVFYYISSTTPLVNVDLLIKDDKNRTLLSWRDDEYCGTGWHIPGGIVRFKETFEIRLQKVAKTEIGINVSYDSVPIAINQMIHQELKERSHFISILYKCYLPSTFIPKNKGLSCDDIGYLAWHTECPQNLIKYHNIYYSKYI